MAGEETDSVSGLPDEGEPRRASTSTFAAARPRVFIVSGVRLYHEGLSWNLVREGSLEVVGAAEPSRATIDSLESLDPHVIVLDMAMPGCLDLARELRARLPGIKLVAFAVDNVDCELVACAMAGISGYVPRDGAVSDLVAQVLNAVRGELHCSPRVAALLVQQVASLSCRRGATDAPESGPAHGLHLLTRRESEILQHIDRGLSNKQIARALNISCATVKNHVHHILQKLQVGRRTEALARLRDRSIAALSGTQQHLVTDGRVLPFPARRSQSPA
jgi:DNA-binding NarL/FixJ family response regulator